MDSRTEVETNSKVDEEILRDRFRGSLMGLAVGDATGTSIEFYRPGFFLMK